MTDQNTQTPFSLNNIRVHLSEIPEGFSRKLKSFITRQPDFNDAVHQLQQTQQRRIALLEQQILQMSNNNETLVQQVNALQQSVRTLSKESNHGTS